MEGPELFILASVFVSTLLFGVGGIYLFSRGWESYEQKYVKGAEGTLEAMYLTIPPQHVAYLSIACFLVLFGVFTAVFAQIVVGIIAGLFGLPVPLVILRVLKTRRDRKFGIQLVDALMNMASALKAGFSLPQAFLQMEKEMDAPISQEFRLVNQELRVGLPLDESLGHLYQRMPQDDLDLVITSILISRDLGGNLTEVFDNIAETIRDRHVIEGKIRALTAQGKLQGVIMALLPFVVGAAIHVIDPALVEPLYKTEAGWALIVVLLFMVIAGYLWIRKIVTIDV
ncbi:MAG: type II secretion system F family protein [Planctomycetes bacterium]|jgi:tight adherence protein B|nr:type II secretion system F family protein [Planctomycetota bacterium]